LGDRPAWRRAKLCGPPKPRLHSSRSCTLREPALRPWTHASGSPTLPIPAHYKRGSKSRRNSELRSAVICNLGSAHRRATLCGLRRRPSPHASSSIASCIAGHYKRSSRSRRNASLAMRQPRRTAFRRRFDPPSAPPRPTDTCSCHRSAGSPPRHRCSRYSLRFTGT